MRKTASFAIALKRTKYFIINLTKEVDNLDLPNLEVWLVKETREVIFEG